MDEKTRGDYLGCIEKKDKNGIWAEAGDF